MQRSPLVIISSQSAQPEAGSATNLPIPPSPLIGREPEVQRACALLRRDDVRLVSMTGPGGVGKTRLALEVATTLEGDFADGVHWVSLAPIDEPGLVVTAIAQALGVKETGDKPLLDSLKIHLHSRQMLLLLDNFEQVLTAAPLMAALLAAAPALKLLVTSRAVLHIRWEYEFPVLPLSLPGKDSPGDVEALAQNPAVALFVQRAAALQPSFALNSATAPVVAEICARLDGLPLAIELAAARIKLLSLPALLARLSDRLRLLTGGAQDLPMRQQTLRNTLSWSYDLLDAEEQRLFRSLSVFARGCTLPGAEAVVEDRMPPPADLLAGEPADGIEVLERIGSLVDKSLLRQSADDTGRVRFWMLETIRSYAQEQLQACGEAAEMHRRHAAYYLAFVEAVAPHLSGPEQGTWLSRLEEEHDNLRAALSWSLQTDGAATALRLVRVLWRFWEIHVHLSEGRQWMEEALVAGQAQPDALRAEVLDGLARLTWVQGDYIQTQQRVEESLALWRKLGSKEGIARELHRLGMIMGPLHKPEQAQAYYEESLALWREMRHTENIAHLLNSLGTAARVRGDYAQAATQSDESLTLHRQLGNGRGISAALANLGFVAHIQGDDSRALPLFAESLSRRRALGDRSGMIDCLVGFAGAFCGLGQYARAARLFSAASALCEAMGYSLDPADQQVFNQNLARVWGQLDDLTFTQAWQEGQGLALEQATAEALTPLAPEAPGPGAPAVPGPAAPAGPPVATEPLLDEAEFATAVQDALRAYTQPGLLQRNPLVQAPLVLARVGRQAGIGQRTAALQTALQEACVVLAGIPRDVKFFRVLEHSYLRPAGTQEQIAELLDLPFSTYRRHLKEGVRRVTEILWEEELAQRPGG